MPKSADDKDLSLVLLLLSFAQLSARGVGQGINYGKPVEEDGEIADAAPDRLFTPTADGAHDLMTRPGEQEQVTDSGKVSAPQSCARRPQLHIVAREARWV
jgi:hypothetical protein